MSVVQGFDRQGTIVLPKSLPPVIAEVRERDIRRGGGGHR